MSPHMQSAIYNSNFSRPPLGPDVTKMEKSNGKSCGYYLRIIFFFSSLIQSLIIVSLVLFLVYGQPEQSAEGKRVQDLEQSLKQVNSENLALKQQKKNLTELLVKRNAEKNQCEMEKKKVEQRCSLPTKCPNPVLGIGQSILGMKSLESRNQQLEMTLKQVESNFTQTTQELKNKMEETTRTAIRLQQEKLALEEYVRTYAKFCKEDFATPLKGIQEVTKAFLTKIDNLFSSSTFPLSCENQQKQIEKVRSSCTNLSKDVEEKFQHYLENVAEQMIIIQEDRSKLTVENAHLNESIKQCPQKRHIRAVEHGTPVQDNNVETKNGLQDPDKEELLALLREWGGLEGEKKPLVDRLNMTDINFTDHGLTPQDIQER